MGLRHGWGTRLRLDFIAHVAFMSVTRKPYNGVHSRARPRAHPHAVLWGLARWCRPASNNIRVLYRNTLLFDVTPLLRLRYAKRLSSCKVYAGPGVQDMVQE